MTSKGGLRAEKAKTFYLDNAHSLRSRAHTQDYVEMCWGLGAP